MAFMMVTPMRMPERCGHIEGRQHTYKLAGGSGSFGTGGMVTKLKAANDAIVKWF